jgi:hypothetical protein
VVGGSEPAGELLAGHDGLFPAAAL